MSDGGSGVTVTSEKPLGLLCAQLCWRSTLVCGP